MRFIDRSEIIYASFSGGRSSAFMLRKLLDEKQKKERQEQGILPLIDLGEIHSGGCGAAHCDTDV